MTRTPAKTIASAGAGVAVVGGLVGLVAIILGIGGDVAVVRSDVARHQIGLVDHGERIRTLELGSAVLPGRLEDLTRRLEELAHRIERLDAARPPRTAP